MDLRARALLRGPRPRPAEVPGGQHRLRRVLARRVGHGLRLPEARARRAHRERPPGTFSLPSAADLRHHWVHADLARLEPTEARELVVSAWCMVVPQKLVRAYDLTHPDGPG